MALQRDYAANQMEWLVFSFRWLLIAATAVLIYTRPMPNPPSSTEFYLLVALVSFNLLLNFFEFFGLWWPVLGVVTLAVDSALGLLLFAATGANEGPIMWIGLLPILTAGLRHRWPATLAVTVTFLLGQAAIAFWIHADNPILISSLMSATSLLLVPAGLLTLLTANQLRRILNCRTRTENQFSAQRAQTLRKHSRAIYDMASMVSATLDYDKVLDAALNYSAMGAEGLPQNASKMIAAALLFQNDELRVSRGWRLPPADHRVICPAREGVLAQVTRLGDPIVITEPDRDPELQQFVGFRNCKSLMALPLRVGVETYGAILYGHPQPDFFDEDQRAFFTAMVNQANIALQNARLYQSLRGEKERLIEVQEEANKKLARDLHDGPTQAVAALAMRANFARRLLERDAKAASEELFKMEDLARRTTKEIRHMLFTLRPLVLESQGLSAALKQLAEKMRDTHGQNVLVETDPNVDELLEKNQQGVLFCIAEEAVNNARKHAQAEHIWVRLKADHDTLVLDIQDDGVGFNLGDIEENYDRRGSLGLVNIRERADMLNGMVRIDSAEGKGTRITVFVPLANSQE
ncbi:MAG: histidine kinase [Anaerolineales bacterium]|nr:histidine kinase [Anaerolineales bacterium]